MKGVDALGPMLEPQVSEGGQPAKTKDGKPFDAVLAEAVEAEPSKGKAAKLTLGVKADPRDESGLVVARSIHSAIQLPAEGELGAARETEKIEEPLEALEEPKTPQQDQLVLAQVATVVARIVAPAEKQASTPKVAASAAKAAPLPSPAPSNDVAPPVRAQEFQDALSSLDSATLIESPHDAQTLRPGASESMAPEAPRGPIGRALQALTGEHAPMRAAADKVMTAFRALSGRDQTPTVPAPAPNVVPEVSVSTSHAIPPPTTADVELASDALAPNPLASDALAPHALAPNLLAPNPLAGSPLAAPSLRPAASGPEMPTVRPGAPQVSIAPQASIVQPPLGLTVQPQGAVPHAAQPQVAPTQVAPRVAPTQVAPLQVAQPQVAQAPVGETVPGQVPQSARVQTPTAEQPATADAAQPVQAAPSQTTQTQLPTQEPANAQSGVVQQAANSNGVPGQQVVVQVQPQQVEQPLAEEATREQTKSDKSEPEDDRVHGFTRGGWTGPARSAYGGRGHEGGERSGSERGETGRTIKREDERTTERAGESAPQFLPLLQPQDPQLQPPPQAAEVRPQNVPQNQPAAAPAPVRELPDIVFQGRADPTAASENATISLHHPDLGPIQLEVHRDQGRVEVHAVIESHHAQAVLRANESGIRQGVQQAGMTFNALRVRVRGEEQPNKRAGQERGRRSNQRET
ncbi:MAG TPA: flagellar hook-length control protein FliK [Polyangiales bacterium]|nr:flagellar hook-length control protein FliK [Polyangiales bacterium]